MVSFPTLFFYISINRLLPVRSPLLGESQLMSLPKGTEMFHFPSFASCTSTRYLPYGVGFPIQKSPDHRILPPPRSLSQAVTSFIASDCQGIHHVRLIT